MKKEIFWRGLAVTILCVFLMSLMMVFGFTQKRTPPPAYAGPPTPSSPHAEYELSFLCSMLGTPPYTLSQALSEVINKSHPWLRATNAETLGFIDDIRRAIASPKAKKTTIFCSEQTCAWLATRGYGPFKDMRYSDWKIVAVMNNSPVELITLDPKIKTWRDMQGKRINTGPVDSMLYLYFMLLKEAGWGNAVDKMKLQPMPVPAGKDALIDRLIDVTIVPMGSGPPAYMGSPASMEITARHRAYGVDWGADALKAMSKYWDLPAVESITIPPGKYGLSNEKPHDVFHSYCMWLADITMPDEVVYELTKTLWEHVAKLGEYHVIGKATTTKTLTSVPVGEKWYHPGALKLYKEKGATFGK